MWLGESLGGSPVIVKTEGMLWFRDEGGRHLFLPWAYGSVLDPRFVCCSELDL